MNDKYTKYTKYQPTLFCCCIWTSNGDCGDNDACSELSPIEGERAADNVEARLLAPIRCKIELTTVP